MTCAGDVKVLVIHVRDGVFAAVVVIPDFPVLRIGYGHRRYNIKNSAPGHRFFCAYITDGVERVVTAVTAGFQQDIPAFHIDIAMAKYGFAVLVFCIDFHVAVEMDCFWGKDTPMISIKFNHGTFFYKYIVAEKARHGIIVIVIVGGGFTYEITLHCEGFICSITACGGTVIFACSLHFAFQGDVAFLCSDCRHVFSCGT